MGRPRAGLIRDGRFTDVVENPLHRGRVVEGTTAPQADVLRILVGARFELLGRRQPPIRVPRSGTILTQAFRWKN